MSKPSFKPGDKVQHKTGGPVMCVDRLETGEYPNFGERVHCTWFKGGKPESGEFDPATLQTAKPKSKQTTSEQA